MLGGEFVTHGQIAEATSASTTRRIPRSPTWRRASSSPTSSIASRATDDPTVHVLLSMDRNPADGVGDAGAASDLLMAVAQVVLAADASSTLRWDIARKSGRTRGSSSTFWAPCGGRSAADPALAVYHAARMFIGHFALGLAAKRATPRVSLAVLFARRAARRSPVAVLPRHRPRSRSASIPATRRSRRWTSSATRTRTRWCSSRCGASSWPSSAGRSRAAACRSPSSAGWSSATGSSTSSPIVRTCRCIRAVRSWDSACGTRFPRPSRSRSRCSSPDCGSTRASPIRATRSGAGRSAPSSVTLLLIYVANIFSPPPPSVKALSIVAMIGGVALHAVELVGGQASRWS